MHIKPKLGKQITSLLMTTVMTLTSITFTIQNSVPIIAQAATATVLTNNNMVVSSTDYVANLDNIDPDDCSVPEYQMLRFSLIDINGATSTSPNGFVDRDDTTVIKNNPISVWNSNGDGATDFAAASSWDYIQQLVNPKYNSSADYTSVGHRLNSRRDYSASSVTDVLSYGATWVPDNASNPTGSGHYELSSDSYFKTSYVPIYADESIPLIIDGGGSTLSKYQQNPPSEYPEWATMDNRSFFDAYTQAAFIPDEAAAIGVTQNVPDFILRILAIMTGHQAGPYYDKATFDEVFQIYEDYIASGKYELLVEPLQVFENTGSDSLVQTLFGDIKYVALTSAEVGMVDDACSGINYGYSEETNRNKDDGDDTNNNYNFLTGADSPTKQACMNLYNSLLLSTSDWNAHLLALSDGIENGNNNGAGDQFKNIITSNQNFLTGSVKSYDLGSALGSGGESDWNKFYNATADSISGSAGPYFNSIFYYQIYKELEGTSYNADTAKSYSLGSYGDPVSYVTYGGMSIIKPVYSTVDITTSLIGVGDAEDELVNNIPVYNDSYASSTDGTGSITIKAGVSLNFDDNATSWNDKVVTNVNNGSYGNDEATDTTTPTQLTFSCSSTEDSGSSRYARDIGDSAITDTGADVYLPAYTKVELTVTYADEDGNAIAFTQVDGSDAVAGNSIITDSSNTASSKMFLENIAALGWHSNASDTSSKAIEHFMSIRNAESVLQDSGLSRSYMIDSGIDSSDSLTNNIDTESGVAQAGFVTIKTPEPEDIPENAAYYLVTVKSM